MRAPLFNLSDLPWHWKADMRAGAGPLPAVSAQPAYAAALSGCRADAASRWSDAVSLERRAAARGAAGVAVCGAVLAALRDAARWREAMGLLRAMGAREGGRPAPSARDAATAVAACARAGRWVEAIAAVHEGGAAAEAAATDRRPREAAIAACARVGKHREALALLGEMEAAGKACAAAAPGGIAARCAAIACVRECGTAPGAAAQALGVMARVAAGELEPACRRDELSWLLLVRACDVPGDREGSMRRLATLLAARAGGSVEAALAAGAAPVRTLPPFDPAPARNRSSAPPPTAHALRASGWFEPVLRQPGWQRRPKNKHDLVVYASARGAAPLAPSLVQAAGTAAPAAPGGVRPERHDWAQVPGAMLLSGVLGVAECDSVLAAAAAIGFTPDEPDLPTDGGAPLGAGGSAGEGLVESAAVAAAAEEEGGGGGSSSSAGIDACVWCVPPDLQEALWRRVAPLLPPRSPDGATLEGLNRRWRIYRYAPGAVYRPHVDGDWPPSGVVKREGKTLKYDEASGPELSREREYRFDMSGGKVRSRLTFLLYLNDGAGGDFRGGETTFYAAGARQEGGSDAPATVHMVAARATPRKGCVLVFPQGHGGYRDLGAPVHEGSAVLEGVKFVARTDVLYTLPVATA